MRQVAEEVFQLPLSPRSSVNAYLLGDVLVDAGYRLQAGRVLAAVRGRVVSRHVLTHAHVDHAGGSRKVVDTLGVPVFGSERDLPSLRSGEATMEVPGPLRRLSAIYAGFPALPEAQPLAIGSEVGPGFVVLDTPGHTVGHISLWRERDRVLVCGDVINSMHLLTTRPGIQEPPAVFTPDPARNRESIRALAALEPHVVLVGHGPPVIDASGPLRAFADALPAD
ncbi:MBL fold metallo-hydrolase [Patulibacter defluvii]|uniref:MBL fold metallo-hydrolase n=1 Tax=Patulibacter defluvii TaxID=3095358 RepID=UPI002A759BCB|nr:MBL fold metallo-hydrolase [Patulibacter sp. DM4]